MSRYQVRHLIGPLLGMACLAATADAADSVPNPAPVRFTVRADWSNPADAPREGWVRPSSGTIKFARVIAVEPSHCRIIPSGDEEVRFVSAGSVAWCGLEMVIEAPPDASIELAMDGHRMETPLDQLFSGSVARMEWDGWVRLRRDPADTLRVRLNRQQVVLAPKEEVGLDVEFNLLTAHPRVVPTHVRIELRPVREAVGRLSAKPIDLDLRVPTNASQPITQPLTIHMPDDEGAYELFVRAEPAGLKAVERTVQFVVVSPHPTATVRPDEPAMQQVQEIDPAAPVTGEPWYSARRLLPRTTRLGHRLWSSMRHPFGAADRSGEVPTNLWRLNVKHPGLPHLLKIDYEPKGPLVLAASIAEQDPDGRWLQTPVSSGIKLSDDSTIPGTDGHEMVFWPQTNSPTLSLYVEGAAGVDAVKKLRLSELPGGLPPLEVQEPDGPRRLFGMHLDGREAWQGFGGSRAIDAGSGLAVDDWQTFLDSTNRLAEYMKFAGYSCVQTTVVGGGGAIYPTVLVAPDLHFDSGPLADSAPDPFTKDVVELLFRVCERNRLGVVPSMRLDGPIPAIDRKLADADVGSSGLLLVSRDGKPWDREPGTRSAPARRYNPLNPEVQAAVLEIVQEFAQRYAAHAGFEALALDLAADSHWVLPGLDWGYDDRTVEQFARDTGVKLPAGADAGESRFAQRHQLLTGPERERWTAWRCRQLATFYERVLAELQQARPRARLVLTLTTLSGTDDLRQTMRQGRTVEEALRVCGIDLRNCALPRDILVLRPFAAAGPSPEGPQLSASRELEDLVARIPGRGVLCVHEPDVLSVAALPHPTHSSKQKNSDVSVALVPVGRTNLRRFAQGMAGGDCQAIFDGGRAVPLGQEQRQREFARVFRSLPASEFETFESRANLQPLVVRAYHDTRDTILYVVNDASYTVEAGLSLNCSTQTVLTDASTAEKLPVQTASDGIGTRLTLEPFQTTALRLSRPDAALVQCSVVIPTVAEKGLKARFDRISRAMRVLDRDATRTLDGLPPNGDFEEAAPAGDTPARWTGEGDAVHCVLDPQTLHGGQFALQLAGSTGHAVVSESFAAPGGRALALNVWLRADRPGLRVRWILVGNRGGETVYRCCADVNLKNNWEPKQFRARNLPDGLIDDIQIKFQLLDAGTVWIDEARVCALPISTDEQRAIHKSVSAISKAWKDRRVSDFERLADGYWATYLVESVEESTTDGEPAKTVREERPPGNM